MLHPDLREFYEASPMREGVLCWYPFESGASVLDLSGGILTELLQNRCGRVVSGGLRGGDRDGGRNDGKFDYIILLDPEDFSVDALTELRENLNDHGRLLLAYENPFGLRYWNGKPSPVTGLPYDSLFRRGRRPSAAELRIRLKSAEFEGQKWYYPLTDHWLTQEVYSDSCLPDEYMNQRFLPYMADYPTLKFDERRLYREVIRGGAFEFMCGAYLVEARACAADAPCVVDYAAVTTLRAPSRRFATTVRSDGTVMKMPLHADGRQTIRNILKNHEELADMGVNVVQIKLEDETLVMPRLDLPTLLDYWAGKLTDGTFDENEMFGQFDRIREAILKASATGRCYWELVPANCFYDAKNDELIFFDQEHYWEEVSPDVAVVRALWAINYSPAFGLEPRARTSKWLEDLKERYRLAEHWEELSELADAKTREEVFGGGGEQMGKATSSALKGINERRKELTDERT